MIRTGIFRHRRFWNPPPTRRCLDGHPALVTLTFVLFVSLMPLNVNAMSREAARFQAPSLATASLADIDLPDEGVLALGVTKPSGDYVGAPHGDLCLEPGDTVLLYERSEVLVGLQER